MKINKETLKALKPCSDRWKNYLEHYDSFDSNLKEFLALDKITNDDKLFVIKNLIPKEILIKWSALCAESVLHIYENKHPEDKRVRDCIEYLLLGNFTDREMVLKHRGAVDAAASCAADAAIHAADAAAYAAAAAYASVAYADIHAADAAAAYPAIHAADAVAYVYDNSYFSVATVDAARGAQWTKNYNILVSLIEG